MPKLRTLFLTAFSLLLPTGLANLTAAEEPARVLLIHTFARDFEPYSKAEGVFRLELARQYESPIEFTDASLQMARFDGPERDQPLINFLSALFESDKPDLVVPIGAQAALFWNRHRGKLFPEVPTLLLSIDKRRLQEVFDPSAMTSVGLDLDLNKFLENVFQLLPTTERFYVICGKAPLDSYWESVLQKEWQAFDERAEFIWLSDRPLAEAVQVTENLPPNSVVLAMLLNLDAAGLPYKSDSALRRIYSSTQSPIFGYLHSQLGNGIVGGPLLPMEKVGEAGAQIGAAILRGAPPSSFNPLAFPLDQPAYDARELERWNISQNRLPEESAVLFHSPNFWQAYRTEAILGLSIIGVQAVLIMMLVTARRKASEANASLNLAADTAKIGLWQRSPNSDEFTATHRFKSQLGLEQNDRVSLDLVQSRIHPEDRPGVLTAIEEAGKRGEKFTLEHRIELPTGETRWISTQGRVFGRRNGKGYGTLGATLDITEQREMEKRELAQQTQLAHFSRISTLGALSAAITHEICQPLNIILNNAQAAQHILAASKPDLQELREIVDDIVAEDRRAGTVIRRLMSLMRRGETNAERIDLHDCLSETIALCRKEIERQKTSVSTLLLASSCQVLFDKVQLQQVILNLVTNACDAMSDVTPDQRILKITTTNDEDDIIILFEDQGIGLPDNCESIFEPFHSSKPEGMGMGLTICRTIVDSHGGSLKARHGASSGAILILRIPVSKV